MEFWKTKKVLTDQIQERYILEDRDVFSSCVIILQLSAVITTRTIQKLIPSQLMQNLISHLHELFQGAPPQGKYPWSQFITMVGTDLFFAGYPAELFGMPCRISGPTLLIIKVLTFSFVLGQISGWEQDCRDPVPKPQPRPTVHLKATSQNPNRNI